MADRNYDVSILLGLVDKATPGLDKFNKSVVNGMKTAGLALSGLAIGGVALISSLVREASKQEKTTLLLARAMKTANLYTDQGLKSNLDYAESLSKVRVATDDEIISIQTALTRYGTHGEMLNKLTKATIDLATAKGMDLTSAGEMVAKSIGTETNALMREGVVIEGAAGSTERMTSAVNSLTKLFGGAGEAYAKSFSGQMTILSNRIGELKERIGFALMPTIQSLMSIVEKIITWFEKLSDGTQKVIANFLIWTTVITGATGAGFTFLGWLPQAITGLIKFGSTLGTIVLRINPVISGLLITVAAIAAVMVVVDEWNKKANESNAIRAKELTTIQGKIALMKKEKEQIIENWKANKISEEEAISLLKKRQVTINQLVKELKKSNQKEKKINKEKLDNERRLYFQIGLFQDTALTKMKGFLLNGLTKTKKATGQIYETWQDVAVRIADKWQALSSALGDATTSFLDVDLVNIEKHKTISLTATEDEYNKKKENIEKTITDEDKKTKALAGLEEWYQGEILRINTKADAEELAAKRKYKDWARAEAYINLGVAVTKAFAQTGILGFITGALVAASCVANIQKIEAQSFQHGVQGFEGGAAWVGESGKELATFPPGTNIYSNPESMSMLAGANGININVYGNYILDEMGAKGLAKRIGNVLFSELKNKRNV